MTGHRRGKSETQLDYSQDTWISLLGLLRPMEFLVTVDHFPIWRRHLAWAKTTGSDLRTHITQRFSSSMVFMSLLLGAELGVLFNSSAVTTEMRTALQHQHYGDGKYWIGVTIILSVCVTLTALVATFTAWGMISSISDTNMRCVIRSSIGQYVTQLPTHLVVMALYLFMFWVVLFLVDIMSGFMRFLVLLVVGTLFLQVVVAYSAFGRLIVHTGAMGKKPVLSPELEQALLPSGLHASLLIKATTRKKKRTSVVSQYRSAENRLGSTRSLRSRGPSPTNDRQTSFGSIMSSSRSRKKRGRPSTGSKAEEKKSEEDSFVLGDFEEHLIRQTARAFSTSSVVYDESDENKTDGVTYTMPPPKETQMREFTTAHRPDDSSDSSSSLDMADLSATRKPPRPSPPLPSGHKDAVAVDANTAPQTVSPEEPVSRSLRRRSAAKCSKEALAKRESCYLMTHLGRSPEDIRHEWDDENAARQAYDLPPPPELPDEDDYLSDDWEEDSDCEVVMPRASVLNRHVGWKSLRRLVSDESPHSSMTPSVSGGTSPMTNILTPVFGLNSKSEHGGGGGERIRLLDDEENPMGGPTTSSATGEATDRLFPRQKQVMYASFGGGSQA